MPAKRNKKQIFLLYSCDSWETTPMPLVCATTSALKLKKAIIYCIKTKSMEYNNGEELSIAQQIKMLNADWKTLTRNRINDKLKYGFYDYTYCGEIM